MSDFAKAWFSNVFFQRFEAIGEVSPKYLEALQSLIRANHVFQFPLVYIEIVLVAMLRYNKIVRAQFGHSPTFEPQLVPFVHVVHP